MKFRSIGMKLSVIIAPLVAAIAMTGPSVTQAAGATILIDGDSIATNCGKYSGMLAATDPVAVVGAATSGSTVLFCPGTYTLSGPIPITGKKLTIKRALTGENSRPILTVPMTAASVLEITGGSNVTIDGLVIDARDNTLSGHIGINLLDSSGKFNNIIIYSPDGDLISSWGMMVDSSVGHTPQKVTITSSLFMSYTQSGIVTYGPVSLTVSACTFQGHDFAGNYFSQYGVVIDGSDPLAPGMATGSVTQSRILDNGAGVGLVDANKVTVANNTMVGNNLGVTITATGTQPAADNNKITGNTILSVPFNGVGIYIDNTYSSTTTMKKLTISNNLISAAKYTPLSTSIMAIKILTNTDTTSVTISGNMLMNFGPSQRILNDQDHAILTLSKNDAAP